MGMIPVCMCAAAQGILYSKHLVSALRWEHFSLPLCQLLALGLLGFFSPSNGNVSQLSLLIRQLQQNAAGLFLLSSVLPHLELKWGQKEERGWDFGVSAMLCSKVCVHPDGLSD